MSPRDWEPSPYSRVYHSITTDPKFVTVYHDDAALAAWLRLLLDADAAWPNPAAVPRRTDQRPLDQLAAVGLVDLLPGDRYLIHGLDAERLARSTQASEAGKRSAAGAVRDFSNGRWTKRQRPMDTSPTAVGLHQRQLDTPPTTVQLDETSRDEKKTSREAPPTAVGPTKDDDERLSEKVAHDAAQNAAGVIPEPPGLPSAAEAGAILASIRARTLTPTGATP